MLVEGRKKKEEDERVEIVDLCAPSLINNRWEVPRLSE